MITPGRSTRRPAPRPSGLPSRGLRAGARARTGPLPLRAARRRAIRDSGKPARAPAGADAFLRIPTSGSFFARTPGHLGRRMNVCQSRPGAKSCGTNQAPRRPSPAGAGQEGRRVQRSSWPPLDAHGHARRPLEATGSGGGACGQRGTRCCCSGCRWCSCCGWRNGGSWGCCSRSRRAAPAGRGTARSLRRRKQCDNR